MVLKTLEEVASQIRMACGMLMSMISMSFEKRFNMRPEIKNAKFDTWFYAHFTKFFLADKALGVETPRNVTATFLSFPDSAKKFHKQYTALGNSPPRT